VALLESPWDHPINFSSERAREAFVHSLDQTHLFAKGHVLWPAAARYVLLTSLTARMGMCIGLCEKLAMKRCYSRRGRFHLKVIMLLACSQPRKAGNKVKIPQPSALPTLTESTARHLVSASMPFSGLPSCQIEQSKHSCYRHEGTFV
jgi:hypothetical protein